MSLPAVVLLSVLLLDVGQEVGVALLLPAGLLHGDLTVLENSLFPTISLLAWLL